MVHCLPLGPRCQFHNHYHLSIDQTCSHLVMFSRVAKFTNVRDPTIVATADLDNQS